MKALSRAQGVLLRRLQGEPEPVRVRASSLPSARALVRLGLAVEVTPLDAGAPDVDDFGRLIPALDAGATTDAAFVLTSRGRRLGYGRGQRWAV